MAERVGFEPTVEFPLHSLSRRALSTAQTPLRSMVGFVRLAKAWGSHNGEGAQVPRLRRSGGGQKNGSLAASRASRRCGKR